MFNKQKGFTLIELLIVIALIGVLAVALLSTINPLEQTRKAQDASRKAAAAEALNSIERFQATFFCYPWEITLPGGVCGIGMAPPTLTDADLIADLTTNTQEMKPEFFTRSVVTATGTNALSMSADPANLVHICFAPASKTFLQQAKNDAAGGTGTTHVCVPE